MNEEKKELCNESVILRDQIMFSAETYYNVMHYIVHKMLENSFTLDELEELYHTVMISKMKNEEISRTFFKHLEKFGFDIREME